MKKYLLLGLSVGLMWLVGCPETIYLVQMRPTPAGLQRQATSYVIERFQSSRPASTSTSEPSSTSAPARERISPAVASARALSSAPTQVVSGTFKTELGGSGLFAQIRTQMGSAYVYSESFWGQPDFALLVQKRLHAADELSGVVRGWLMKNLKNAPGAKPLKKWLETDFPADLRNLSLYAWTLSATASIDPQSQNERLKQFVFRTSQYLFERGYFDQEDLVNVLGCVTRLPAASEWGAVGLPLLQKMIARRMGYATTQPVAKQLAFISDGQRLAESLFDYARTSEPFKKWKQEHLAEIKAASTQPVTDRELAWQWWMSLVGQAFEFGLVLPSGQTAVGSLNTSTRPGITNGQWDEQTQATRWEMGLRNSPDGKVPLFRYAAGGEVNEAFQREHFGRVILTDGLVEYLLWHHRLNERQVRVWDGFVESLRPGPDLEDRLAVFGSNGPATRPGEAADWASQGIKLLQDGLRPPSTQPASAPASEPTTQP